jgi:hypothetical protein
VTVIAKDGPGLGDVHVNRPMGRDLKPGTPVPMPGIALPTESEPEEGDDLAKARPQTLYVCRQLLNADEVIAWAKGAGFKTTYPADEMHVTVMFSRNAVDWMKAGQASWSIDGKADLMIPEGGPRVLERFGLKQNCAVLLFASTELAWRHEWLKDIGCTWDWEQYEPHVTISQSIEGLDLDAIEPYQGKLHFGPEVFAPLKENAMAGVIEKAGFHSFFKAAGVDEEQGIVYGWGIVCKEGGVDYHDTQGNHIPEGAMVSATTDFMKGDRDLGDMHVEIGKGVAVHSFPLTTEIAKNMGITTQKTGWMVGAGFTPDVLAKFKSGEYTGFSIGGEYLEIDGKAIGEVV